MAHCRIDHDPETPFDLKLFFLKTVQRCYGYFLFFYCGVPSEKRIRLVEIVFQLVAKLYHKDIFIISIFHRYLLVFPYEDEVKDRAKQTYSKVSRYANQAAAFSLHAVSDQAPINTCIDTARQQRSLLINRGN